MKKKTYVLTHSAEEGYILFDKETEAIVLDVPVSETDRSTSLFRGDVRRFLAEKGETVIVEDSLEQANIIFENGHILDAYYHQAVYEGDPLTVWGL